MATHVTLRDAIKVQSPYRQPTRKREDTMRVHITYMPINRETSRMRKGALTILERRTIRQNVNYVRRDHGGRGYL